MGTDISCCLAAGVRCYKVKTNTKVTKYNVDTGHPYIKEEVRCRWIAQNSPAETLQIATDDERDIITPLDIDDCDEGVFGMVVGKTGSNRNNECIEEVSPEKAQETLEEMKKRGFAGAKLYLITEFDF